MKKILAIAAAAATLTAGAALLLPPRDLPPVALGARDTVAPVARLDAVAAIQARLHRLPRDWRAWAALGISYVERARITADPAYYPKAEEALRESLRLKPGNADGLAGQGALANARHDFGSARDLAHRALESDSYDAIALDVLADALTQLGAAAEASAAVQRLLDVRPGLPAYARGAYDLEQHGRLAEARELWLRAAADAHTPQDVAYVQAHLGDLAWLAGEPDRARGHHEAALRAQPDNNQAAAGLARVQAGAGDLPGALALWAQVTARTPAPGLLIEYAAVLTRAGKPAEAAAQLALAEAGLRLFAAAGGRDDLGEAEVAIAQGQPDRAVAAARREWSRRKHADVADALAWALHLAGRDAEALGYIHLAQAQGNPRYTAHRVAIEAAVHKGVRP
jgi:tetratricopeptide (TPR) repeat protein